MAVPVQTWGSMGSMVPEQHEFGLETSEYLEANEVYDLFAHLLRQVIINQPEKPLQFLQDELRNRPPLAVCVIGPAGINRSKYCQQIASDFGIKLIHVGNLLRSKYKDLFESAGGVLLEDEIVIPLVKTAIKMAQNSGWVLDGFPRTKVQAQALTMRETGFCLDKVLLLHAGEKTIRQHFSTKFKSGGHTAAEKEDLINTRLQQYNRHIVSIVELYKNVIRQIEVSGADDDTNPVYDIIRQNLHVRPYSYAPMRSHRICIIGACSSGRTTQCQAIAKGYGLVHIDPAKLMLQHQKKSGQFPEEVPLEYVGDEELCKVVGKRLNEIDCLRKGWVLDGFPKTKAQAEFLRQAHLWPTRLISVVLDEESVQERALSRRVDPVTCAAYYRTPTNEKVAARLVHAEYDQPDKLKERYVLHMQRLEKVAQSFPLAFRTVNGDLDIGDVTQEIKDRVNKPSPSELAQDADTEE